jgi:SAM-dependent methyltransferase
MLEALEDIGQTSGMDMSDEAVAFSREVFKGIVRKGFLPELIPYDEESFDLITALDVIEHLDADVDALKAMRSRLRPGGKMIVTVPAYMFLWSYFDVINEHKRRYTRYELRSKLQAAGLTIEKISYFNCLLFPVVFAVRKLNNLLKRNDSSDIDMPSQSANFFLKMIFGLEKYLLRFVNLPFGVSILAVVKK